MRQSFAIGIGGAAGQGVATPGDIFAKIFSRRGLHLNVYNAYQSIIRGGHTFLTIRTGPDKITNMGDRVDLLQTPSNPVSRPTEYSCARSLFPSWPTSAATK
jgi:2-oxoglutarate ferredoxin oxidoreductase subunit alpha